MNELPEQLRRLGELTEQAVAPVDATTALDRAAPLIEAGGDGHNPVNETTGSRRSTRPVLAVAAALLVVVGASVLVLDRRSGDEPVDTATRSQIEASPDDDNGWNDLRECESTSDYTTDTGNTFYGAYQFSRSLWNLTADAAGQAEYVGTNPADAPREVQDALANALYLERGAEPWLVCGSLLRGPMLTPVVPQLLGRRVVVAESVIVFLDPGLDSVRQTAIQGQIFDIIGFDQSSRFVDEEEAYAEFRESFADRPDMVAAVTPEQMPTSFRIDAATLSPRDEQRLRDIDGVFEVVSAMRDGIADGRRLRLVVPAIEIDVPVHPTATLESLATGTAVLAGDLETSLVVGGHGSVEERGFGRLGELVVGDRVEIRIATTLQPAVEQVRHYEVTGVSVEPMSSISPNETTAVGPVTLIADVAGAPDMRTLVTTRPLRVDFASYGDAP